MTPSQAVADRGIVHPVPSLPASVTDAARQPGTLESRWLAAALVATGLIVLAAWTVAAVRRRRRGTPAATGRRRGRRVVLALLVALPLLAGVSVGVNNYVGYAPTPAALGELVGGNAGQLPPAPVAGGLRDGVDRRVAVAGQGPVVTGLSRLVRLTVAAPGLGMPALPVFVLLPPGYDDPANAAVRYPVVYLLHGYPSSARDWVRAGRPQQAADLLLAGNLIRPMILVFPSTTPAWSQDTECLNARPGPQVETYLTGPVVDTIDRTFRTLPDRAGRAIGGSSAGGYGALNLGLQHLDRFSVILAMQPYGDPGQNAARSLLAGDAALLQANSPTAYVPTMRFDRPVATLLSAATEDRQVAAAARMLATELADRGQYTALRIAPGLGHTWRETRAELPYALAFADRHLTAANG